MVPSDALIIEFLKGEGLFLIDHPDENGKWSKLIRFRKGLTRYSVIYEKDTCSLQIFKAYQKTRRPYSRIPTVRGFNSDKSEVPCGTLVVSLYDEDSLSKIAAFL